MSKALRGLMIGLVIFFIGYSIYFYMQPRYIRGDVRGKVSDTKGVAFVLSDTVQAGKQTLIYNRLQALNAAYLQTRGSGVSIASLKEYDPDGILEAARTDYFTLFSTAAYAKDKLPENVIAAADTLPAIPPDVGYAFCDLTAKLFFPYDFYTMDEPSLFGEDRVRVLLYKPYNGVSEVKNKRIQVYTDTARYKLVRIELPERGDELLLYQPKTDVSSQPLERLTGNAIEAAAGNSRAVQSSDNVIFPAFDFQLTEADTPYSANPKLYQTQQIEAICLPEKPADRRPYKPTGANGIELRFDEPFLWALRRSGQREPYLAIWFGNAALFVKQ